MSIITLLQSFDTSDQTFILSEDLRIFIQMNKTEDVNIALISNPNLVSNPHFLQCFIENFTVELAYILYQNGLNSMSLLTVANKTDIKPTIWSEILDSATCEKNVLFQWALDGWEYPKNSVHQKNVSHLLSLFFNVKPFYRFQFLQHVASISPRLDVTNENSSFAWNTQQWNFLEQFSSDQWQECFGEIVKKSPLCDTLILSHHPNALENLFRVFQRLPLCLKGLDQHYQSVSSKLSEIKRWTKCSEGLQGSPMYKNLPVGHQKDFFDNLQNIYIEHIEHCCNFGYEQRHLMGISAVDLFLRRFVEFEDEDFSHHLSKTFPNFEIIFSNRCQLSVLHTLMQKPNLLLQLDQTHGKGLAECLNDEVSFRGLFEANVDTLDKIFKRFPQIVQWTDSKGNTLAHWYTVNHIINEDTIHLFHNHGLLAKPNNFGFVVRDIIIKDVRDGIIDPNILSVLDRHVLMSHVTEHAPAPSIKRKI